MPEMTDFLTDEDLVADCVAIPTEDLELLKPGDALKMILWERADELFLCTTEAEQMAAIMALLDDIHSGLPVVGTEEELAFVRSAEGRRHVGNSRRSWQRICGMFLRELTFSWTRHKHGVPRWVVMRAYERWLKKHPGLNALTREFGPLHLRYLDNMRAAHQAA
jgi:hypothetical protein